MVMGPTHAMSGAAAWLGAAAIYANSTGTHLEPGVLILGTAVTAGAALAPDIDSYSSTVSRSFGFLSRGVYHTANAISITFYNVTRSKYDQPKDNGHRTFFHTTVMALVAGGLTSLATAATGTVDIWGNKMSWGQLFSLVIMGIFLHLAMGGLFNDAFKKMRARYGTILLLGVSAVITAVTANILPAEGRYAWLGLAVGFGWFIHLLGDMITKMGVPILWPIKIRGYRWWDVSLPSFMRISAGGTFEYVILVPLLTILTVGLGVYHGLMITGVIK